jgi:branched chain amino acid efflux pump
VKLEPLTLLAILGMALATYATRVSGLYLMRGVTVKGRLKAALDALPPAILMAVIAPTVLATGAAETLAAVITAGAAFLRLPLVVTIIIGVVSVVALRHILN